MKLLRKNFSVITFLCVDKRFTHTHSQSMIRLSYTVPYGVFIFNLLYWRTSRVSRQLCLVPRVSAYGRFDGISFYSTATRWCVKQQIDAASGQFNVENKLRCNCNHRKNGQFPNKDFTPFHTTQNFNLFLSLFSIQCTH